MRKFFFFLIRHTKEGMDQAFSKTSERLRSADAVPLKSLHLKLCETYMEQAPLGHLESTVN